MLETTFASDLEATAPRSRIICHWQFFERESIQLIQSTRISAQHPLEKKLDTNASPPEIADQKAEPMAHGFNRTATDNELIMRYSVHDDANCFEELFRRHSNLVLQVCRSILGNYSDADDAFQATFLVLVRKADRLLHVTSLSAWLYKVAFRISVKANQDRRRKSASELQNEISVESDQLDRISQKELMTVVFHELNQLPTRYQQVLIECYLQGKTYQQAAETLDHSEAAIKGLIARAKKLIRNRLLRRGVALTFALAVLAKVKSATAAELATEVSPLFQEAVSNAANLTSHSVSSSVQSLTQFGGPSMGSHVFLKSSLALGIIIALVLAATGSGNASQTVAHGSNSGGILSTRELEPDRTTIKIAKRTVDPASNQDSTSTSPDDEDKTIHRVIRLQFVDSEKAAEIVSMFFEAVQAKSEAKTNSIIATGSVADLEKVTILIKSIDLPAIAQSKLEPNEQPRNDDQRAVSIEYELSELDLRRQATKLKIEALRAESRAMRIQTERTKQLSEKGFTTDVEPGLQSAKTLTKESEALFAQADLINIEKKIFDLKNRFPKNKLPEKTERKKNAADQQVETQSKQ